MKKIKVLKTVPILKNPKSGTYYKEGEEIKNPSDIILQVAKVHPDVFSIVEEIEKEVKKVEKEVKKIETKIKKVINNTKKIEDTIIQSTKIKNEETVKKMTTKKKKRRKNKKIINNLEVEE